MRLPTETKQENIAKHEEATSCEAQLLIHQAKQECLVTTIYIILEFRRQHVDVQLVVSRILFVFLIALMEAFISNW